MLNINLVSDMGLGARNAEENMPETANWPNQGKMSLTNAQQTNKKPLKWPLSPIYISPEILIFSLQLYNPLQWWLIVASWTKEDNSSWGISNRRKDPDSLSVFLENSFSKVQNRPFALSSHLIITRMPNISWVSWWVLCWVHLHIRDPDSKMPFCILKPISSALSASRKKKAVPLPTIHRHTGISSPLLLTGQCPLLNQPCIGQHSHTWSQLHPNHRESRCRKVSVSQTMRMLLPEGGGEETRDVYWRVKPTA